MKKIFSFDAETDGLWGNPFAVAAIVYQKTPRQAHSFGWVESEEYVEVDRICLRLPDSVVTNQWVKDNVLPTLSDLPVTHDNYEEMLAAFADFYKANKADADCICHMGYIVEAHLLREMHRLGFIGDWDAPYPLYDVSGNLQAAGEDATSVDSYARKHGLQISDYGTSHNPLYDCEVAAKVYLYLQA